LRQHLPVDLPREIQPDVVRHVDRERVPRDPPDLRRVPHVEEDAKQPGNHQVPVLAEILPHRREEVWQKRLVQNDPDVVAERDAGEEALRETEEGVVLVEEREARDRQERRDPDADLGRVHSAHALAFALALRCRRSWTPCMSGISELGWRWTSVGKAPAMSSPMWRITAAAPSLYPKLT